MRCSIAGSSPLSKNSLQHADLQARERLVERRDVVRAPAARRWSNRAHRSRPSRRSSSAASSALRGDHAALIEARGEGDHAVARHAAVGGLDAGDAAQRRRLADRAAGIGRRGSRCQARGDRGRRAARGAAGHARRVPGIAHRPEVAGLVGRAHRELVHVGLAEHHGAGLAQPLDHGGVVGRDEVRQHARAAGGPLAAGTEDVLVRDRHAGQRPALAGRAAPRRPPRPARSAAARASR